MEKIYNIFIFFENDKCSAVGYKSHDYRGSDDESLEFLKSYLSDDFKNSQRTSISKPFTRSEYNAKCRLGEGQHLYDEVFLAVGDTSPAPLFIATPVKDGELFFHYSSKHGEFDVNAAWNAQGEEGHMEDWLLKYTNEDGIDLSRLIHDDYYLKAELKRQGITYDDLAARLNEMGFVETKASIANKVSRGAFTAAFFLASLRAAGTQTLRVEDL